MRLAEKYCAFLFLVICFSLQTYAKDFTVVIDAGHGGKDYGALGSTSYEKNINLDVALKLGSLIESNIKDVKVVYTRDNDTYLTLQERAEIANRASGDLFISIHTNSIDKKAKNRKTIKGAATYTLGLHRTEENLDVAKRENSVIALEKDYTTTYQGFDPNSTESYIIFEIFQNVHLDQSISFAKDVQAEFVSTAGRTDNGVRQAGFWVLAKTSMPAVLIELDFICNPLQEKFLSSEDGQNCMAKSIYNAFCQYKRACDIKGASPILKDKPVIKKKNSVAKDNSSEKKTEGKKIVIKDDGYIADLDSDRIEESDYKFSTRKRRNAKKNVISNTSKPEVSRKEVKVKEKFEGSNKSESKAVAKEKKLSTKEKTTKGSNFSSEKVTSNSNEVVYRIQFLTSLKELSNNCPEFKGLSPVGCYSDNGLFKYTFGEAKDKKEASEILKQVKLKFKEAFIVPFKNNKRVVVE